MMNGRTFAGDQKYHCKNCGCFRTLVVDQNYSDDFKRKVVLEYKEKGSLRKVCLEYGIVVSTLRVWIKLFG